MWAEILEKKACWIGGTLTDHGDQWFPGISDETVQTRIVDLRVVPNGKDNAFFEVEGEDFTCGGATSVLGVTKAREPLCPGGLAFMGYGGHYWSIEPPATADPDQPKDPQYHEPDVRTRANETLVYPEKPERMWQ